MICLVVLFAECQSEFPQTETSKSATTVYNYYLLHMNDKELITKILDKKISYIDAAAIISKGRGSNITKQGVMHMIMTIILNLFQKGFITISEPSKSYKNIWNKKVNKNSIKPNF